MAPPPARKGGARRQFRPNRNDKKLAARASDDARRKWLHHNLKALQKTLKKAKQFEVRKIIRRIAESREGKAPGNLEAAILGSAAKSGSKAASKAADLTKLEQQLEAAKHADVERLADVAAVKAGFVLGEEQGAAPEPAAAPAGSLQAVIEQRLLTAGCVKKHLEEAATQFRERFQRHRGKPLPGPPAAEGADGDTAGATGRKRGAAAGGGDDSEGASGSGGESDGESVDSEDEGLASAALQKLLAAAGGRRGGAGRPPAGNKVRFGTPDSSEEQPAGRPAEEDMDSDDVAIDLKAVRDAALRRVAQRDGSDDSDGEGDSNDLSGSGDGGSEGGGKGGSDGEPADSFNSAEYDQMLDGFQEASSSGGEETAGAQRGTKAGSSGKAGSGSKGSGSVKRQAPETGEAGGPPGKKQRAADGKTPAGKAGKAGAAPAGKQPAAAPKAKPVKNRVGQRERRRLAELKYGADANHLKKQTAEPAAGGATATAGARSTAGSGKPTAGAAEAAASEPEHLHPSWEAKRRQKAALEVAAQPKAKVVFGDDGEAAEVVVTAGTVRKGDRKGAKAQPLAVKAMASASAPAAAAAPQQQRAPPSGGRGAPAGGRAFGGGSSDRRPNSGSDTLRASSAAPQQQHKSVGKPGKGAAISKEGLHPSWLAAQARREAAAKQAALLAKPAGVKVVFDD